MELFRYVFIFILSLLGTYFLTPVFRRLAIKIDLLDRPNPRKIHSEPIPIAGGFGFLFIFITLSLIFLPVDRKLLSIIGAVLVIFLTHLVDDLFKSKSKDFPALPKFLGQVTGALILISGGVSISVIKNPFTGGYLQFSTPVSTILTVVWVVGVSNIINFADGLDGLASSITAIASGSLAIVSHFLNRDYATTMAVILLGISLGFIRHNMSSTNKVFMGDSGAYLLGFILGTIAIEGTMKTTTAIAVLVPFIILGQPIIDTGLKFIKKTIRREPFYKADREHLHFKLLNWGLTSTQALIFISLINICFSLVALVIIFAGK
ncbi:TPA: undecaprenyl/decaprenyl-phosphate alpha-N-acetylglucosaminyl 1-phosphate transferase [bacterium]|jgi:UDP-GlcNAc:undecaprenyl-phosphate GlcNAc-1-phosphate transferase|nr:undecaprenyl/decaprenyl-phosphate alpha-N-acetylglucosaminyl 1-phosphate transferase [bacterium]HOK29771.1 MraY family glycosyltransferase [bacterium]HOL55085.1 MraY family glycosyltransferase [bacterium]HPO82123.1 MraY family glycosyltransferase [bacterium]HRU32582.1 MraY family glycosyltransferase [bacterium]